ncbi:ATP-binding cassette domain-containing protein, partial [bacterium]|nr:ATP-binding cassette domain-containing protein [bacterium]
MSVHLSIENLCVEFNGFRAVTDLNLTVNKGELRCLIGPNGAGKTTALDLICGKTKPTSGAIRYKGTDLAQQEEYLIARAGVGRKFQVPSVFRQLSVRQNLEVAFCRHTGVAANVLRPGQSSESDGLEKLADFVGLIDQLDVPAAHLSHG